MNCVNIFTKKALLFEKYWPRVLSRQLTKISKFFVNLPKVMQICNELNIASHNGYDFESPHLVLQPTNANRNNALEWDYATP